MNLEQLTDDELWERIKQRNLPSDVIVALSEAEEEPGGRERLIWAITATQSELEEWADSYLGRPT